MGTVRYLVRFVAICAAVAVIGSALTFLLVPQLGAIGSANRGVAGPVNLDALPQRSLIYASNGDVAATLFADQNRSSVSLSQVPHTVQAAILAVEDENFYSHKGINLRATLRALFTNVSTGEVQQGGSTITMQLIKNALPTPKRDLERKTQEAVLAWRLEQVMSKSEILERYLNTVYFGNGAYGVQAAAELYFGKNVSDLDWPEAAMLASLIRDPRDYDPFTNPTLALERRHLALQRLVETGNLAQGEADLYNFTPLPTAPSQIAEPPRDYFVDEVKQLLLDDPSFNLGSDYTERYNAVFEGGLRIYTTLDPALQLKAIAARNDTLPGQDPNGLFVINGGSPQHLAGLSRAQRRQQSLPRHDRHGQRRSRHRRGAQPRRRPGLRQVEVRPRDAGDPPAGSSMKAFVLAAALENGIHVTDTISGATARSRIPGHSEPVHAEGRGRDGESRQAAGEFGELRVLAPRPDRRHRQGDRPGSQDGHHVAA